MTRFARAKGSKASNERTPNDATPWHVMKQQLLETTSNDNSIKEKTKSAKELLKEQNEPYYHTSVGNIKYDWAEFEESKPKKNVEQVKTTSVKVQSDKMQIEQPTISPIKKNNEKLKSQNINKSVQKDNNDNIGNSAMNERKVLSKRQKRNLKNHKNNKNFNEMKNEGDSNSTEIINNQKSYDNNVNNFSRKPINQFNTKPDSNWRITNNFKKPIKRKAPKLRDDKEHKRRKPDIGSVKMTINGIDVEIVKFDGFPVKKEDADRLKDLRQQMIMRGIPKKEIDAAMKLERRKAEKALTRIKKCVCFHCRKSGHNLSDCPELDTQQVATGICFKCGSTEHTHFECKVSKPGEFRFATCFICREQGHIAKQCPDNPKGVYPEGGACKVCGDVTHLKKDCPNLQKEKEESTITLATITDNALECLEDDTRNKNKSIEENKPKKIVKF